MKNQKETKSNPPAKSNAPLLIIGIVLLAALLGGWYLLSSSKPAANVANRPANTTNTVAAKTPAVPANAPPGAQPPNQAEHDVLGILRRDLAVGLAPRCCRVRSW